MQPDLKLPQREAFAADPMHVVVPRAAGLDVHKMQVTATVRLCEPGGGLPLSLTREFSALPRGLAGMTEWLLSHGVTAAAMEGTGVYWLAPYEALEEAGIAPSLFHAQHVKQSKGRKTDIGDSVWLARVCQLGLAAPSYVPPKRFRHLRQLCRCRRKLVAERSRARNRLQKVLDHDGLRLGGALADILGTNGRRILHGLAEGQPVQRILAGLTYHVRGKLEQLAATLEARLDRHSLWTMRDLIQSIDALNERLQALDERMLEDLQDCRRQLQLLETMPGVSLTSACAILAELGPDPGVFPDPRRLGSWAGVCPGNDQSAGKRRSGRARKGNPTLRATLAECAQAAVRTKGTQFHGYHGVLSKRIGYKRAILATAYRMLRAMYRMLSEDRPCRDPAIDYEELVVRRNAPRWLRKLNKYGFLEEERRHAGRA